MCFKKMIALALLICCFYACSSDNDQVLINNNPDEKIVDDSTKVKKYRGTQSPGDIWEWELNGNNNTFISKWDVGSFDDVDDDITITGTYTTLPSGFLELIITDSSPVNDEVPTDGSAKFYALNLPDMAMILKPEGSIKGDIISCAATGSCNDIVGKYSYFVTAIGGQENDATTVDAYGTAVFSSLGNDNEFQINGFQQSLDCISDICSVNTIIKDSPTAKCTENGSVKIVDKDGKTQAIGQFTSAGVMMLDQGKGNGGLFALDKTKAITIDDIGTEEFYGLFYEPNNSGDKVAPINLSFKTEFGKVFARGKGYKDIVTGDLEDDTESIKLNFNSEDDSILFGDIQEFESDFAASIISSDGKKIMVLTSTTADNDPFIMIVVNK